MAQEPPESQASQIGQFVARVYGRVQGVNFRYYTRAKARSLGLAGHVRNLSDGSVQILAQGEDQALRSLLTWLHRGPSLAEVSHVEVTWQSPQGPLDEFEVHS